VGAAAQVTSDGGSPALKVLLEGDTNVMAKEVVASDSAASTGLAGGVFLSTAAADDDVAMEELGVILGHPHLGLSGMFP
jgi:hypothetical protein